MLIFEKEITAIAQRDLLYVEPKGNTPLSVDVVAQSVEPHLDPGVTITGVTIFADPERSYKVNLSEPKHAAIYVNQYSGEVLGPHERLAFFQYMFRLHRWLMDTRPENGSIYWGKMIVGTSTLMMVIILITGAILWIPKSRKALRNRLQISLSNGRRRFMHDLHVAGGIYATLLLLVMALTGLTWSFEWYNKGVHTALGIEYKAKEHNHGKANSKNPRNPSYEGWQIAYENVRCTTADATEYTISKRGVSVKSDTYGNQRASDRYSFDKAGAITKVVKYEDSEPQSKLRGWLFSLHVGSWGGITTRIMWLLASLIGATLPLTGYYLWFKRKFSANNAKK
jgi:uncharacterized iron-regulated membrane protein